jgi:hypothetical protein
VTAKRHSVIGLSFTETNIPKPEFWKGTLLGGNTDGNEAEELDGRRWDGRGRKRTDDVGDDFVACLNIVQIPRAKSVTLPRVPLRFFFLIAQSRGIGNYPLQRTGKKETIRYAVSRKTSVRS